MNSTNSHPREAELIRRTDKVIDNAAFERAETYDILLSYGIHHRDADWAVNKLTERTLNLSVYSLCETFPGVEHATATATSTLPNQKINS